MRENGFCALHGYRALRWEVRNPTVPTVNLLKLQFSLTRANMD
jgi:hypothetical protein